MKKHHPDLSFKAEIPTVLVGILKFDMCYDPVGKQYVINPGNDCGLKGERIRDSYEIEIRFEISAFSSLPQVYERGGRIDGVARDRKKRRVDLHFSRNEAACLCLKTQENEYLPQGFNLPDYFYNLVIPFFYAQSYFGKHGKWPWGEYSHEDLGYLEGYGDIAKRPEAESALECLALLKKYGRWNIYDELLKKRGKLKIHRFHCFCGSRRKIRKCHPKAFEGLCKLKEDIESLGFEL